MSGQAANPVETESAASADYKLTQAAIASLESDGGAPVADSTEASEVEEKAVEVSQDSGEAEQDAADAGIPEQTKKEDEHASRIAELDKEIERLSKEHEERVREATQARQADATPAFQLHQPIATPAPAPEIDPEVLTDSERYLLNRSNALEQQLASINAFVQKQRDAQIAAENQATIDRAVAYLDKCMDKHPEFVGDTPMAKFARERATTRMLYESSEPPQIIAAKVAKQIREIEAHVKSQYLQAKLKSQSSKSHSGSGRAPGRPAAPKGTARDLLDGTATRLAMQFLKDGG